MRARNIKPAFFKNEDLAECQPMARLLFVGLWCMSLKEGIIEYRPKKIKAEIFPYEDGKCNIEKLLEQLSKFQLITFYENDTQKRIILVNNFLKHQKPHKNEKSCGINDLTGYREITGNFDKLPTPLLNVECGMMKEERGKNKEKYGEFKNVFISADELKKLKEKFPDSFEDKIEKLSGYMKSKGKRYSSHYATILTWARKDGAGDSGTVDSDGFEVRG